MLERKVLAVFAGVWVCRGQFQQGDEIGVIDAEDFASVRQAGFKEDFEEPVGGGHHFAASVCSPNAEVEFEGGSSFASDLEQAIASDGFEWLDPPVEEDGGSAKGLGVKPGLVLRQEAFRSPESKKGGDGVGPPGSVLGRVTLLHDVVV